MAQVGIVYIALGDKDKAFGFLDQAEKVYDMIVMRFKVDSRFESLRSDPRLDALVKRIGIP